jgi:F-type H+-transporting ATPase subunit alpha
MDDVPVDKIKDFQARLMDFLNTRKADLLMKLRNEKAISDALAAELKTAVTEFKQTYH